MGIFLLASSPLKPFRIVAIMSSPPALPLPLDQSPLPDSTSSISSTTKVEDFAQVPPNPSPPRLPSFRTTANTPAAASMTASSTPLGTLNAARRPGPPPSSLASARAGSLPQDMQAKMRAFHLSRPPPQNLRLPPNPPVHSTSTGQVPSTAGPVPGGPVGGNLVVPGVTSPGGPLVGGVGGFHLAPRGRPQAPNHISAPAVPSLKMNPKMSLAAKRGLNRGMKLSDASGPEPPLSTIPGESKTTHGKSTEGAPGQSENRPQESLFTKYSEFVDTKTGTLKFKGKATIHGKGIDFSSGTSFSISLDEVDNLEELGKGNYGTVYKVRHSRPQIRRPGLGLSGNKPPPSMAASSRPVDSPAEMATVDGSPSAPVPSSGGPTGLVMAMKEIRLELDEAKFAAIIMELDILHRCISPFIVDFYGAFFQEGAVYICMEYMDGGSIDKLYGDGIPEGVLRKITKSTVIGLKALKDEHNIIHRDVKPTNILVNSKGQVKICDFGVSGNLVASIAKTNIGCQSYMAPERIASGGVAQAGANPGGGSYSVQSDIWSLGLTIIECAMGQYPYPPETYNNIFSQLSVSLLRDRPRWHFS